MLTSRSRVNTYCQYKDIPVVLMLVIIVLALMLMRILQRMLLRVLQRMQLKLLKMPRRSDMTLVLE